MFLYLTDVTLAHGATRIVSRELTADVPVMQLSFPRARVSPERLAAWEAAAISAAGPRGSLLVYGADVVHRGTEMTLPGGGRFFFNLAYRPAGADWVGAESVAAQGDQRLDAAGRAPERAPARGARLPPARPRLLGRGDVRAAHNAIRDLDLTPWREAAARR